MIHFPRIGRIIVGAGALKLEDGRVGIATEDPFCRSSEAAGLIIWFADEEDYIRGTLPGARLIDYSCGQEIHASREAALECLSELACRPSLRRETVRERNKNLGYYNFERLAEK